MNENIIIFTLFIVGIIIIGIYEIYNSVKENKEQIREEQLRIQWEEQERIKNNERRKKESYKWNKLIQSKYNENLLKDKYKTNKHIKVLVGDYIDSMAPYTNSILKSMGIETEIVSTASDIIDRVNDGNKYDIIITNNVYDNSGSNNVNSYEVSKIEVEVIDFSRMSESEILTWCSEKKLNCNFKREYSDTVEKDGFIKQSVYATEKVTEGSKITVTYSLGKEPTTEQKNSLKKSSNLCKNNAYV